MALEAEKFNLEPISEEVKCSLSWKDLSYFIPLPQEKQYLQKQGLSLQQISEGLATGMEQDKGVPLPKVVKRPDVSYP